MAPAADPAGGLADWGEPMVVRPTPSGAPADTGTASRPAQNGPQGAAGHWDVDALLSRFPVGGAGLPPLVAAALPLLNLAYEIRHRPDPPDLEALRPSLLAAMGDYEREIAMAQIGPDHARAAHYVVCATIDDVILMTPWGADGGWAQRGLVSTFHMDVTGGERVFDLVDHFHRDPGTHRDILLLLYLCLSLGFEGRTRVSPRGILEHGRVREGLYRTLKGQFGSVEHELSPHWRGENARHQAMRTGAALWTALGVLVLFLLAGFLLTSLLSSRAADPTLTRLASIGTGTAPSVAAIARPEPAEPPATRATVLRPALAPPRPEPVRDPRLARIEGFLQPEVDAGLVALRPTDDTVLVRIRSSGLFGSGSAAVGADFEALLDRIGRALAEENLTARVIGHTDSTPIRTIRFPSNWELSQARADAVADILRGFVGAEKIVAEGRADTEPLATNATAEGRDANRRVDIVVLGRPRAMASVTGAEAVR
ncbi:MAG: type VI secretion system protein TssL, long form [Pseudomonadota bacterium]